MSDTLKPELRQRVFELYKPPFEYCCGYILDSEGKMVADDDSVEGAISRVRGWGNISYMPEPEALQDAVGTMIAEALNDFWSRQPGRGEP